MTDHQPPPPAASGTALPRLSEDDEITFTNAEFCRFVQEARDQRTRADKAEADLARTRAEADALKEWRDSVSNVIKQVPEFHTGQWGGDKEGWGYHFEIVAWLIRERAALAAPTPQQQPGMAMPPAADDPIPYIPPLRSYQVEVEIGEVRQGQPTLYPEDFESAAAPSTEDEQHGE